jgi:hypothetical protein
VNPVLVIVEKSSCPRNSKSRVAGPTYHPHMATKPRKRRTSTSTIQRSSVIHHCQQNNQTVESRLEEPRLAKSQSYECVKGSGQLKKQDPVSFIGGRIIQKVLIAGSNEAFAPTSRAFISSASSRISTAGFIRARGCGLLILLWSPGGRRTPLRHDATRSRRHIKKTRCSEKADFPFRP